jgi:Bacterial regulatory helix-turn-helix protein, lysR family
MDANAASVFLSMEETRMSAGSILAWLQGRIASMQLMTRVLAAYAEMNMDKITDLNDVQAFVIASRTGSLSAVALELGKPTSTVSGALTRLEKDLGVLLMRRGSRGLTLTDDGEGYLSACKGALRSLQEGGLRLKAHQSNPSGLHGACLSRCGERVVCKCCLGIAALPLFMVKWPENRKCLVPVLPLWKPEPIVLCAL